MWGWLAQIPVLWRLRFPEGTCGSPQPTTKSRGPAEQVRATIVRLGLPVERDAAGKYARAKALPKGGPFGRSQTLKGDRLRQPVPPNPNPQSPVPESPTPSA